MTATGCWSSSPSAWSRRPTQRAALERISQAQADFNRGRLKEMERTLRDRQAEIMKRAPARPFVIANDDATIAAMERRRLEIADQLRRNPQMQTIPIDYPGQMDTVAEMARRYKMNSAKLTEAYKAKIAEYDWVEDRDEVDAERYQTENQNVWSNQPGLGKERSAIQGGFDLSGRVVTMRRSDMVKADPEPKAIPVAPAPGRRKIRLED